MKNSNLAAVLTAFVTILSSCNIRVKNDLTRENNWATQEKINEMTVGISLSPPQIANNSILITLQNERGEAISDAKVKITSLKKFLLLSEKNLTLTPIGGGTYIADTDIGEGRTEMNMEIVPKNGNSSNLRININLEKPIF